MKQSEFLPYQVCLALKNFGYSGHSVSWYGPLGLYMGVDTHAQGFVEVHNIYRDFNTIEWAEGTCTAVLWQQAFDFFRQKFGMIAVIEDHVSNGIKWSVKIKKDADVITLQSNYASYERARFEAVKSLIDLLL